jgi:hypothetical protein
MDEDKPTLGSLLRFGIRDLLWLTVVVACLAGWGAYYFHWHRKEPLRDAALSLALQELMPHGITRLDDATNVLATPDGKVSVMGHGIDNNGALRAVFTIWTVSDFGSERRWQLEAVMIDGKIVLRQSSKLGAVSN